MADDIRRSVQAWPSRDFWTVGVQMIRTADAIGANIAEATGRWSRKDQVRCLYIARGEAHELQHWLARSRARELPCPESAIAEANRVGRMLNGLIGALLNGRVSSL